MRSNIIIVAGFLALVAAAERVGLGRIFEEAGSTGVVLIADGRTKEVTASIRGSRDVAEYRAAIDATLKRTNSR